MGRLQIIMIVTFLFCTTLFVFAGDEVAQDTTQPINLIVGSQQRLVLQDGSIITGNIMSYSDSEIVIKSSFGEVSVERKKIKSIEEIKGKKGVLYMKDGTKLIGRKVGGDQDTTILQTETMGSITVKNADVARAVAETDGGKDSPFEKGSVLVLLFPDSSPRKVEGTVFDRARALTEPREKKRGLSGAEVWFYKYLCLALGKGANGALQRLPSFETVWRSDDIWRRSPDHDTWALEIGKKHNAAFVVYGTISVDHGGFGRQMARGIGSAITSGLFSGSDIVDTQEGFTPDGKIHINMDIFKNGKSKLATDTRLVVDYKVVDVSEQRLVFSGHKAENESLDDAPSNDLYQVLSKAAAKLGSRVGKELAKNQVYIERPKGKVLAVSAGDEMITCDLCQMHGISKGIMLGVFESREKIGDEPLAVFKVKKVGEGKSTAILESGTMEGVLPEMVIRPVLYEDISDE